MGERLLKTAVLSATLGIALIAFCGMSLASDDFAGGCKRKEQAIETKMEYARKHGNQEQLRGLEEALSQVRQWCSDGTLRSKAELNILEKQDKVKERQADLDKAVTEGKGEKKIAKLQRKPKRSWRRPLRSVTHWLSNTPLIEAAMWLMLKNPRPHFWI
jgi:hypothetical protein